MCIRALNLSLWALRWLLVALIAANILTGLSNFEHSRYDYACFDFFLLGFNVFNAGVQWFFRKPLKERDYVF